MFQDWVSIATLPIYGEVVKYTVMNKIFVVEDDIAVRESLQVMLETKGFTVEAFDTGSAFLDQIDGKDDGVLLLDLQLPDMNGEEILATLSERGKSISVIVMTGGANKTTKQRAMEIGAVIVLDKPINNSRLLEIIDNLL